MENMQFTKDKVITSISRIEVVQNHSGLMHRMILKVLKNYLKGFIL